MTYSKIICDKTKMLDMVKINGLDLIYGSFLLKDDFDIVLEAVKQNGLALKYASKSLQNNKKIVIAAMKETEFSFIYASEKLKDSYDSEANGSNLLRQILLSLLLKQMENY